jgi:hypothetical protein
MDAASFNRDVESYVQAKEQTKVTISLCSM